MEAGVYVLWSDYSVVVGVEEGAVLLEDGLVDVFGGVFGGRGAVG